jgi:hypothetical protein
LRLDLDGPPHRNPDARAADRHKGIAAIRRREGFGDKWATPAPLSVYPNTGDLVSTLTAFMQECRIVDPPQFQMDLFS